MSESFFTPDWPAPESVRSLVTTRRGGVSSGPYASFNLGPHTGDDPAAVAANRARLSAHLPSSPRWLQQVHGTCVVCADEITEPVAADASFTTTPGVVCAIMVADCLPVLLADRGGRMVAAAHCGWRGLAGGIIANTVGEMSARGVAAGELIAYIGPGIGPSAFEVGADVREAFTRAAPKAAAAFKPHAPGKWLADLALLARQTLARAGVMTVRGGDHCTWSDAERFYSYRRDRETGRMAALIWLA